MMSGHDANDHEEHDPFHAAHVLGQVLEYSHTGAEAAEALRSGYTVAKTAEEVGHILSGGGFSAAGTAGTGLIASGAALAPLSIVLGGQEMLSGIHHADLYEGFHGGLTMASGAASATSLVAGLLGSSSVAGAAAVAAPLAGAGAFGLWAGHELDETFHISDELSGPAPADEQGYIPMKRGDIDGANRAWVDREVQHIKDMRGDNGDMQKFVASISRDEDFIEDPGLENEAKAIVAIEDQAKKQQVISDNIRLAYGHEDGMVQYIAKANLHDLLGHYED